MKKDNSFWFNLAKTAITVIIMLIALIIINNHDNNKKDTPKEENKIEEKIEIPEEKEEKIEVPEEPQVEEKKVEKKEETKKSETKKIETKKETEKKQTTKPSTPTKPTQTTKPTTPTVTYTCPSGYVLNDTKCITTVDAILECPKGTHEYELGKSCINFDDGYEIQENDTCPNGYGIMSIISLGGPTKYYCLKKYSKIYTCEFGYTLNGTKCTKTINATKK